MEAIDKEIAHALGVIDAALELVTGIAVRDTADYGLLAAMRRRRRTARGVGVGRRRWRMWVLV